MQSRRRTRRRSVGERISLNDIRRHATTNQPRSRKEAKAEDLSRPAAACG
jgi:hypothetical protein